MRPLADGFNLQSRLALAAQWASTYSEHMEQFTPTKRTKVQRLPDRGKYDYQTVFSILDEGFVCHVGFVVDGQPFVIPTNYGRIDKTLYLHGSSASRMLRTIANGIQVCVTVTLVDGLVLARSAFHHSVNYRSVVILGRAVPLETPEEKMRVLEVFTNHVVPGRWKDIRQPTEAELKATSVLALPLEEASAKVRVGPPKDDEPDYTLPIWAGVLPLTVLPGPPISDPQLISGLEPPANVRNYSRNGGRQHSK
jgi:nitroimidazol reductase NimA-like FMN-containing flavoprotein (pyridoxamine 5'-phosphate oxidase superfamily)